MLQIHPPNLLKTCCVPTTGGGGKGIIHLNSKGCGNCKKIKFKQFTPWISPAYLNLFTLVLPPKNGEYLSFKNCYLSNNFSENVLLILMSLLYKRGGAGVSLGKSLILSLNFFFTSKRCNWSNSPPDFSKQVRLDLYKMFQIKCVLGPSPGKFLKI